MNFNLIDVQGFLKKKREVKLLGKPTLEKAYLNGLEDQLIFTKYPSYTHYERLLRNTFQLQVNKNYEKHQKNLDIKKAIADEKTIYKNYVAHVEEYKRGLSRKNDRFSVEYTNKKERKVKTEIVFCFDASFGMYHIPLFQAVNKFIDLLGSIDLKEVDVAIVAYGSGVNTVSEFSDSKAKLLFSTAMILPVGGVTIIVEKLKFAAVSDNDLFLGLTKANNLFYDSKNAVNDIKRHIVVLSDGNLSGVIGGDLESYEFDRNALENQNLEKVLEVKKTIVKNRITLSSISLQGDNSNIIKELSEIIFWEENVKKINANVGLSKVSSEKPQKLIDMQEHENRLRDTMKLNLKYIQQEQYKGDVNV